MMNAKTPREGLAKAKLLQSHYPQVVETVQLHVNWAGEMTEGLDKAAREAIQTITPSYSGDVDYLINDRDYLIVSKFRTAYDSEQLYDFVFSE